METDRLVAILGTVASLVGVLLAGIQTIRLKTLKRQTNADSWLGIRLVRSIINSLERSGKLKEDTDIARAYASTVDLFRQLLKQAVLAEPRFTETTIQLWKQAGKLETPWQMSQARHFLETTDIETAKHKHKDKNEKGKDENAAGTGSAAGG
jgi:hypothetical protein